MKTLTLCLLGLVAGQACSSNNDSASRNKNTAGSFVAQDANQAESQHSLQSKQVGGFKSIDASDPDAIAAANFVARLTNSKLQKIEQASVQVAAGLNLQLTLDLLLSDGSSRAINASVFAPLSSSQQLPQLTNWQEIGLSSGPSYSGFAAVDINDANVIAAAKFACETNKQGQFGAVEFAQKQVSTSGSTYFVTYTATTGNANDALSLRPTALILAPQDSTQPMTYLGPY